MRPIQFSVASLSVFSKNNVGKHFKYVWLAVFLSFSYHSGSVKTQGAIPEEHPTLPVAPAMDSLAQPSKTIYFTFDDGPNRGTPQVVDVLCQEEMPATFFLVGSHIFGSKKQFSQFQNLLSNPCFEAANHSFYHAKNRYNQYYRSPEQVLEDFTLMSDSAKFESGIARTPGMNVWRTANITHDADKRSAKAADLLKENGYSLVGWDVEWKAKDLQLKKSPEELVSEIEEHFEEHLTKTENHLVLLLHDQHFTDTNNIQSLQTLIKLLKGKQEYAFKQVSEYPCLGY